MKIAILSFYGRQKRIISSNRIYGLLQGLSKLGAMVYFFTAPTSFPPDECFDLSFCEDVIEFSVLSVPKWIYEIGRGIFQGVAPFKLFPESWAKSSNPEKDVWPRSLVSGLWYWRYSSPIFRDNVEGEGFFVLKQRTAYRLLRYVLRNEVRILFTSHNPPISHELGLFLKRKLGSRLYWIADFRDPLIDEYIYITSLSPRLARLQRATFLFADLVTMVSHSMIEDALDFVQRMGLNIEENKFFCLYNGFFDFPKPVSEKITKERPLMISYTGTIFPGKRDISALLNAFSVLSEEERNEIGFTYVGPQSGLIASLIDRFGLRSVCQAIRTVDKETALSIQGASDILLLLKSDTDRGVFTGKFFEYLFSGKPILVVGDRDEEFNNVAFQIGGIRIVPNGLEGSKQIAEILRTLLRGSGTPEVVRAVFGERKEEKVRRFHWSYLSKSLYDRIAQDLGLVMED
ncbi:MAG: hypothetical protein N3D16_09640 [Anaerolineales bacterium]|nr:hypothetical protein [Anaerolineales bacterium]